MWTDFCMMWFLATILVVVAFSLIGAVAGDGESGFAVGILFAMGVAIFFCVYGLLKLIGAL